MSDAPAERPAPTLHHDWDSLQSLKVRFCLAEKGLPFEGRIVAIKRFENLAPAYLALNPNGVVPTLEHGGNVIIESSIINEYLDEIGAGPKLMPEVPAERARVRMWCRYEDDVMHPAVRPPTFQLMIKQRFAAMSRGQMSALVESHPQPQRAEAYRNGATGPIDYDAVLRAVADFRRILARVDAALERHAWLAGAQFTLADVAGAVFFDRLTALRMSFLWASMPRVADWGARLMARPAWCAAAPATENRMPAPTDAMAGEVRRRIGA